MNKENELLLSFIIPVYNVEKYLGECLDSILSQATDECELILVDDGSTDLSGEICDDYQKTHQKITVIHQENKGLSSARNIGLLKAKGKYVAFFDSDDKIADGALQEILAWARGNVADVCFMQAVKFYPDGTIEDLGDGILRKFIYGKSPDDVLRFLSTRQKFCGSACSKLYRKDFLHKENLNFPGDKRCSEDLAFVRDSLLRGQVFDCLDCEYYLYRQRRQGSITNTFNRKNIEGLKDFIVETVEECCENKTPIDLKRRCCLSFAVYEYLIVLWKSMKFEEEEKQMIYTFLKEYKWIVKYGKSFKMKLLTAFLRLFGLEKTGKLIVALKGQ